MAGDASLGDVVRVAHRSFVLAHTKLGPVPGLDGTRLHLADDVLALWRKVQQVTGDPDAPLPYWAFAWAGGLALASHLRAHPDTVRGRRVFDFGTGSGLVAVVAARGGASAVRATDIDPFAVAAARLNARVNGVRVEVLARDGLAEAPPSDVDLVLAGDTWYEGPLAERVLPWLRSAQDAGIEVLVGDPGRRYLPATELDELASYEVRTTTDLEDLAQQRASVYRLR